MTDLELIVVVLTVFYTAETLVWVRPATFAFVSHGLRVGGRFRARTLDTTPTIRNATGGLLWGSLFPWGVVYLARPNPISYGSEGALGYTAQHPTRDLRPTDDGPFVEWSTAKTAAVDGRSVVVAGKPFLATESATVAEFYAGELRRLAALNEKQRADAIDSLNVSAFDDAKLEAELSRVRKALRFLRVSCTLLFIYMFVGLPTLIVRGMLDRFGDWLIGYAGVLLLHLTVFYLTHRRLLPAARGKRWGRLFTMIVSPADAAKCYSLLQRDLPLGFHPLTVAAILCDRSTLLRIGRQTLLDLRLPRAPECLATDPRVVAMERSFREQTQSAAEAILKRRKVDLNELLAPPPRDDERVVCYCPRCDEQWVERLEKCPTCGIGARAYDRTTPD